MPFLVETKAGTSGMSAADEKGYVAAVYGKVSTWREKCVSAGSFSKYGKSVSSATYIAAVVSSTLSWTRKLPVVDALIGKRRSIFETWGTRWKLSTMMMSCWILLEASGTA